MTTWHDLADQLTADQRALLDAMDDDGLLDDGLLLSLARKHAADNLAAALLDVPAPPDATEVDEWDDADSPNGYRCFRAAERIIGRGDLSWSRDIMVGVRGVQYVDGRVERTVVVGDVELPMTQARELAAVLTELTAPERR